jgi:hypothetical protein
MATRNIRWTRTQYSTLWIRIEDGFDPWRVTGVIVENRSTQPVTWSATRQSDGFVISETFPGGTDNGDGTVTPSTTTLNIPQNQGVRMDPERQTLIGWSTQGGFPSTQNIVAKR